MSLRDRLVTAVARAAEVEAQLSDPATARDSRLLAELGREHRQLQTVTSLAQRLERAERERAEALELAESDDPEMASEAHAEEQRLTDEIAQIEIELKPALVPPDPLDDRPAIVEIRAGTGGDEAALFAAELWRMYTRY
ncbi:MAG TPA: PCRF domain-containing protein, partial [Gemmatimonadaceae bacterium]|nr:PCRF domain-containing protein [Gemmatimonadaceae bacterium]